MINFRDKYHRITTKLYYFGIYCSPILKRAFTKPG